MCIRDRLSIESALAYERIVDLVHIDVQGTEVDIVSSALPVLRDKVKCLVIGTHGREIEGQLASILAEDGWRLCREQSCRLAQGAKEIACIVDGCQMWRNPRLFV